MRRENNFLRSAALILSGLVAAPLAQAEQLGRLFFTPEQRMQLERQKSQGLVDPADNRHELSVGGIVQRHGGERTVWINGVPQVTGSSDERSPDSAPVAIPGQSQPVKVKVGQKVIVNPAPARE